MSTSPGCLRVGGGVEILQGWAGGLGTLLGPEVSVTAQVVVGVSCGPVLLIVRWVGCLFRPYVENFTVDASIFVVTTSY